MAQIPVILSFYVVHPSMSPMHALGTWTEENDRGGDYPNRRNYSKHGHIGLNLSDYFGSKNKNVIILFFDSPNLQ
jgi:hypothetical protein